MLVTGILVGLAIAPLTILLMAIKTGIHAHPIPDYSYEQIFTVISRIPVWVISGLLIVFGIGIWMNRSKDQLEQENAPER